MSNQKLGILAVVAAVMVLLAVLSARTSVGGRAGQSGPAYLIQGLDPASIDNITVGKGKDTIKIQRKDGQFVVINECGYPADAKQINDLITKSLDIKTADLYTSDAKNHEDLELTEDKARNVIKFFKSGGSLLTGVIVGKSRETGQGAYVRLASGDDVYLVEEVPWFRDRAIDYVNQEIVSAKREDVNSVTVTTPDGKYALRSAKEGDNVLLDNAPADKKLKDSDGKGVFTALTSLRFDDVNTPDQIPGLNFDHEYVCKLDNSTTYTFKLAKKGEKTYVQCEATYADKTPVTIKPNQVDSPEELKKKEAKLLAQEHAQRFTLRHKSWVYEVSDWKAKYLTMKQSDLLEDKEKPAETKADAPAPGAALSLPPIPIAEPNRSEETPQPAKTTQEGTTGTPAGVQKGSPDPNQPAKAVQPAQPTAPGAKP